MHQVTPETVLIIGTPHASHNIITCKLPPSHLLLHNQPHTKVSRSHIFNAKPCLYPSLEVSGLCRHNITKQCPELLRIKEAQGRNEVSLQVLLVQMPESPPWCLHSLYFPALCTDSAFPTPALTCINENGPAVLSDVKCLQRTLWEDSGD